MDQWTKSLREDKVRTRSRNPSFSSSLLDAIYRSIDEGEEDLVLYKETMKKKQTTSNNTGDDFTRACLIEKWMEKKVSEKVVVKLQNNRSSSTTAFHSASSSSDSSSAGGFSSSEAESLYGSRIQRPKPIRTSLSAKPERFEKPLQYEQRRSSNIYESHSHYHLQHERSSVQQKVKQEGGFNKTKSKAMKIYGDLKKVKQPISPGGKLATFLNSLFTAGNAKKAKLSTSVNGIEDLRSERKSKSAQTSTCSSASSFSRSCLSKTPSSKGTKSTNATKRSVRFYPVSVIVDEDSRPCGHKSVYEEQQRQLQQQQQQQQQSKVNEELKYHLMEKNRKIEAAAREIFKNYQEKNLEKKKCDYEMRDVHQDYEDDEDEDDDAESYASSDLFELDNFASIGNERYREELPVYETTHLEKNRPISNAYIL